MHYGDPWTDPPEARDPLRRLRGHLVLPVTVWLAGGSDVGGAGYAAGAGAAGAGATGAGPTGLTVSSVLLGQGEPPVLAGLISPVSDFADALSSSSGQFVVHLLGSGHRRLAQHFAGELPAPAELLATVLTPHGPVLEAIADRIFCRMSSNKPFGWSLLVEAEVEEMEVGQAGKALAWYHGAFHVVET